MSSSNGIVLLFFISVMWFIVYLYLGLNRSISSPSAIPTLFYTLVKVSRFPTVHPPPSHLKTVRQFDSGWCAQLDAKNVTASDETVAKVVAGAGGVATLKWIGNAIKTQVAHLLNVFLASAENTSSLGSIHKSWNNRLFTVVSVCCCFVLQFRNGSRRVRDCWFNAVIGNLVPAVIYSAQLYFSTWHCFVILVSTSLSIGTQILYSFPIDSANFPHHFKLGFWFAALLRSWSQFFGEWMGDSGPSVQHH